MSEPKRKITIAVEGCCHGELDNIYGTLQHLEQVEGRKVDLLICCGDFQAVRNLDDLETMACPVKYRSMQSFYKYFSGEKVAPVPTLFIGGNHEAANYLWELYYGGWAAPNIYFLGFMGCVKFGGVRIAGLSGIYKQADFTKGHTERMPYTDSSMRSIYHVRDFEVYRLLQIKEPVDIFLSHDWPRNIAGYGNQRALLSKKQFLRSEVEDGSLGSPANEQLLHALQPSYWFSAHLHVKFAAVVQHPTAESAGGPVLPAKRAAVSEAEAGGGGSRDGGGGGHSTRFLALDKCLPGRDFLQVIEIESNEPPEFCYDEEWLAILRTTHKYTNLRPQRQNLPGMGALRRGADTADATFVRGVLEKRGGASIPTNFVATAPAYEPSGQGGGRGPPRGRMPTKAVRNPQTEELLSMLGLRYNLDHDEAGGLPRAPPGGFGAGEEALPPPPPMAMPQAANMTQDQVAAAMANPEELDLDLEEDGDDAGGVDEAGGGGGVEMNQADGGTAGAFQVVGQNNNDNTVMADDEEDPMFKPL